jgi:CBS-domain-containing membrane protein
MLHFVEKMRGGAELPARAAARHIVLSWLGGFLAIAAVAYLTDITHMPLVLGSFGASCVLVFGFPESPFSQPSNVILGHFISSLIGLVFLTVLGPAWWSMALALATALAAMQITRTVHPPAGSNPLIVYLTSPHWSFLLFPTLFGAIILVAVAVIFNNLPPERCYPKYWLR